MKIRSCAFVLPASVLLAAAAATAQPTNTTLPSGWSWDNLGSNVFDTGTVGTPRGGGNGQTTGPFTDTSFGVMNEPGTPWFTGGDLSSQQLIQRQIFGNIGTNGAPGFRNFNFGYTGPNGPTIAGPINTTNGSNFPFTAAERRSVTLNHWNNTNPDAGGVATFGQIVWVPTAAVLNVGQGWGGDDMIIRAIGGGAGQTTRVRVDANIDIAASTTAFGGLTSSGNRINVNGISTFNDPASLGNYDMPWGFNVGLAAGQISLTRDVSDAVFKNGVFIGDPQAGLSPNSVGAGITDSFNVLASLVQTGGTFSVQFDSSAELFISRQFGNADARAQMGPGMEGNASLVVTYTAYRAVPAPASAALLGLGGLVAARRRRSVN
jgi:hypothetical protein